MVTKMKVSKKSVVDIIKVREVIMDIKKKRNLGANVTQLLTENCQKVGLSFNQLKGKFRRYLKNDGKLDSRTLLNDEQETRICAMFEGMCAINRPPSRLQFIDIVKSMFNLPKKWQGAGWFRGFIKRHKSRLSLKWLRGRQPKRSDKDLIGKINDWIEWYPNWIHSNALDTDWLINADETRVKLDSLELKTRRVGSTTFNTSGIQDFIKGKCSTYLPFIAANGIKIMEVFVLPLLNGKYEGQILPVKPVTRNTHPVYFCFTDSGYLTDSIWIPCLNKLKLRMDVLRPNKPIGLLVDNLGVHKTFKTLNEYKKMKIVCGFFPPNCTHVLQPCDSLVFSCFKKTLKHEFFEHYCAKNTNIKDLGKLLVPLAQLAAEKISKKIIIGSFKRCGIVPFNRDLIVKNIKAAVGEHNPEHETNYDVVVSGIVKALDKALVPSKPMRIRMTPDRNSFYSAEDLRIATETQQREQLLV